MHSRMVRTSRPKKHTAISRQKRRAQDMLRATASGLDDRKHVYIEGLPLMNITLSSLRVCVHVMSIYVCVLLFMWYKMVHCLRVYIFMQICRGVCTCVCVYVCM